MTRKIVALLILALAVRVSAAAAETDVPGFRPRGVRRAASAGVGPAAPPGFSPLESHRWPENLLPHLDGAAAPKVRFKLDEAFRLALRAVREQPSCAALFAPLALQGEDALAATEYGTGGDGGACLRPALAFTCVGCRRTFLCPGFLRLPPSAGAAALIHEALHFGGLAERPPIPGAMSSSEISAVVEGSCHP